MSNDPAWDMPQINWEQQGSWEQGTVPPVVEPTEGTQVWLGPVAQEWLPWICGALDQGRNFSAWIVASDAAMYDTLRRWDTLMGLICAAGGSSNPIMIRFDNCTLETSTDGGVSWVAVPGWDTRFCPCVLECTIPTPPLLPPGSSPATRACNIASYIANNIIHEAVTQAINAYDHDLSLLALAGNIAAATFAFELPWTAAFIYGLYDLYAFFTAGNIAALRAAEADAGLWSTVTCAIYNAIKADGAITIANCAGVIAAICAVTYTPHVIIDTICAYVTQLGCDSLRRMQVNGALAVGDCSGCGTWCWEWSQGAVADVFHAESIGSGSFQNPGPLGAGWYQQAGGARYVLQLVGTMPAGTHVTAVEIDIVDPNTQFDGAGNRSVYKETPCNVTVTQEVDSTLTGAVPVITTVIFPMDGSAPDCIKIYWNSNPDTATLAYLRNIRVRGTGANPFGASNCT